MDLSFDTEQQALQESAKALLASRCSYEEVAEIHRRVPSLDADLWRAVTDAGWPTVLLPEPNGVELTVEDAVTLLAECGRVLAPIPLASSIVAGWTIDRFGTAEQRDVVLPRIAAGDAATLLNALTLGTSDAVTFHVSSDGRGWRLTGTAKIARDAQVAQWFACLAQDDTGDGSRLIVVNRDQLTADLEPRRTSGYLREASVTFSDIAVEDGFVSEAVSGADIAAVAWIATVAEAAEVAGLCAELVTMTASYAQSRVQFGRPIGSFQAVRHRLADMLNDLDCLTWFLRRSAAEDPAADERLRLSTLVLRAWLGDASRRIVQGAQQIHGGVGFFRDHPLHMYFGRQKAAELSVGMSTAHALEIGTRLLAPGSDRGRRRGTEPAAARELAR